jgi:DNA repair protein RadA/Sms
VTKEGKMGKDKTIFVCSSCGYESAKWLGKCPACNEWNSFYEEKIIKEYKNSAEKGKKNATPKMLKEVESKDKYRNRRTG